MAERPETSTAQLKIRVQESTRQKLEQAAAEHGWPLNREISERLEASLEQEERFGGQATASFLQTAATAIKLVENSTGVKWHQDHATWYAARRMFEQQFKHVRPIPPNATGILEAVRRRTAAGKDFSQAYDNYVARYPAKPVNALLSLAADDTMPARLPSESANASEAAKMTEAWKIVMEARREMKESEAAVENAFEEADAQRAYGETIADAILNDIDQIRRTKP